MEILDKEVLDKVKDVIYEVAESIEKEQNNLYIKLINNWNSIERLFFDFDNNYSWPMSKRDFESNFDLNSGTITNQIVRYRRRGHLKEGEDYIIKGLGRNGTTYIYESGAKKILEIMHSIEGAKLLTKYGINRRPKKCFCYIAIIKYATKGIDDPKKEFVIPGVQRYRTDLYLKEKKLAIECDELGHEHESPERRSNRQQAFINELGCRFLRFNPHRIGFDIGLLIKCILYYLLDKKINGQDPIEYFNSREEAANPINRTVVYIADSEFT